MKTVELKVLGMNCPHCERRVVNALSEVEGVISSEANHKKKKVTVEFDENLVNEASIKDVIRDAGYQVK